MADGATQPAFASLKGQVSEEEWRVRVDLAALYRLTALEGWDDMIFMTSVATAFGALPRVLWQGAGAESRQTIGVVIFSGAIFATLRTLFVVPTFYNLLARFTKSLEWTTRQIEAYEREHGANLNDQHAPEPSVPQAAE